MCYIVPEWFICGDTFWRYDLNLKFCKKFNLHRWAFNFRKVVRQENSGAVEAVILPYSAVYLRIQTWKNYWNRSTFAKVIVKIKVARFLWPTVYIVSQKQVLNLLLQCFWQMWALGPLTGRQHRLLCTALYYKDSFIISLAYIQRWTIEVLE